MCVFALYHFAFAVAQSLVSIARNIDWPLNERFNDGLTNILIWLILRLSLFKMKRIKIRREKIKKRKKKTKYKRMKKIKFRRSNVVHFQSIRVRLGDDFKDNIKLQV